MNLAQRAKGYFNKSFHALSHRSFRIFWLGQIVSLIGTWMQMISLPWLAYTITKSPLLLGVTGALQFTPMLIFTLFVGAIVDRFDKRKIIIYTQSALALLALILSILVFTRTIAYWHLLVIAALQGFVNAIDMPSRQTFIIEMTGKEDLMNAIGLNSAIFNAARIIGPALAGVIMAKWGIGFCFLINALSFIPVICGLFFINHAFAPKHISTNSIIEDVRDGLKYIASEKILLTTVIAVAILGTFIMNFTVMVPVLAKTVLKQGETGFGFLMSCMGIGSLSGAIFIASTSKDGPRRSLMLLMSLLIPVYFILIGLADNFVIIAFLLALSGFSLSSFFTTANSMLQLYSRDQFRGRVVSVYSLVFSGTTPIGNLITGALSDYFGIKVCFTAIGCIVIFCVILLYLFNLNLGRQPGARHER